MHEQHPASGDVVIWDKSEPMSSIYWVGTQSRDSAAHLFAGPNAWAHARAAAEALAGSEGTVWKRHRAGSFQKLTKSRLGDG